LATGFKAFEAQHGIPLDKAQAMQQEAARAQQMAAEDAKANSPWTKLKNRALIGAGLGAAGLGIAGYGGYKLLGKGLDVLGQEGRQGEIYGSPMGQAPTSVNQYGQPMY
jgi:hypothetical protein